MEERTFKYKARDWWHRNKRIIRVGVTCGFIGVMYGFIKGMATTDKMWLDHGFERAIDDSDMPCDELGLTEANCDDPEFIDIVNYEIENS